MFNSDIKITGKHGKYMKFLSSRDEEILEYKIFDRYIDVFMIGAVIGFIYGKTEEKDTSIKGKSNHEATIFLDAINKSRNHLNFIYQTIMLLDNKLNTEEEEPIDRAFRDYYKDKERHIENEERFFSFVRGGISFLYETITNNAYSKHEHIRNIKEFIEDFHNDFITRKYTEDIVYDEL